MKVLFQMESEVVPGVVGMNFHIQRLHLAPNNQPEVLTKSLQTAVTTLSLGGALGRIASKFVAREGPFPDGKRGCPGGCRDEIASPTLSFGTKQSTKSAH